MEDFSQHGADRVRHGFDAYDVHFLCQLLVDILHGHDTGVETQAVGLIDALRRV